MDAAPHKLLLLSDEDNVLVALGPLAADQAHPVSDGTTLVIAAPVTLGHKVARHKIGVGEKVVKYGVSIGSASVAIEAGEHVHVHNMQSDYTMTHSLKETEGGSDA